ncbi:unnamed protein product [Rotaria socialis]|uniref:phosphoribosylaminoimidazolesuccinocarboxamide synthase n=2 Tax=Rotaria socialis TaxID=392032 RepID=A0A818J7Q6_9BILA|nr:unnamed protein product [Rotaria socialis]CAF4355539.1 unnamed protein product [Rotaria socialis]
MTSSSLHGILGQKLYDGKSKTIYSVIDQPNLICIHRKDYYDPSVSSLSIPGGRRSSVDSIFRLNNQQQNRNLTSNSSNESTSKGVLTTSITTCVYEILREASIPTFYVASHTQPDIFIAKKCTMIPILWIIRRIANETYVKCNPEISNGHRFIPPVMEIYYKRYPIIYRRLTLGSLDENTESNRENFSDDEDSDLDKCLSSVWSYEQLLNTNIDIENSKISKTDIEYMYEICCAVFDILEHVWMVEKNCQLIDLKIEFGITTTAAKEIVVANTYDVETWHILRPTEKVILNRKDSIQENLVWINNALRHILDLSTNKSLTTKVISNSKSIEEKSKNTTFEYDYNHTDKDKLPPSLYSLTYSLPIKTNRCIIVCSSVHDVEHGLKIKTTLNEIYNIHCDIRILSIFKSTQTVLKFLSNYSYEHSQPTVFVTLGNINNGLAMCLSLNSQYPIIHCSLLSKDQQNNLFDTNSFLSNDTSLFTVVFTLSSAMQNVVQILAMNDWKLWTKQRGRRFKKYMDLMRADQQLITTVTQTVKTKSGMLISQ